VKEFKVSSWEDFNNEIKRIKSDHTAKLLFRGQANSSWKLRTTLERKTYGKKSQIPQTSPHPSVLQAWSGKYPIDEYYSIILGERLRNDATICKRFHNLPESEKLLEIFNGYDPLDVDWLIAGRLPEYKYLTICGTMASHHPCWTGRNPKKSPHFSRSESPNRNVNA